MTISPNTQAILLLTARFSKQDSTKAKPLTPREWGRFAEWLKVQSLTPESLLSGELNGVLHGWQDKAVSAERLEALLNRGSALALSMEKWLRSGLWVITRSDPEYPRRLKQRLRGDSPAVLFGCGNKSLLNMGGLAVVGSRSANSTDLTYSTRLGALAAAEGYSIVSGGARGVDETAMKGALEAEGTAVGVLADSLLRACSSSKYREHLVDNSLVLLSPFSPEAGFNVGNAMQRNKYLYCLADAALAVHSGKKGGTWSGSKENLKYRWVPMWVKRNNDPEAGNDDLIREGAIAAPPDIGDVDVRALFAVENQTAYAGSDLFGSNVEAAKEGEAIYSDDAGAHVIGSGKKATTESSTPNVEGTPPDLSFYELFLAKVLPICSDTAHTPDELVELLGLHKPQLNIWLKQAVADGKLEKLNRPVRYQATGDHQATLDL